LLKASVDCDYAIGRYGDGYSTVHIPLVAGEWRRVVIYQSRLPAGREFTLAGWPDDASGPAVSFTALQVLVEPAHSSAAQGFLGAMLGSGAVNPNRQ
jgi:hypothetical protein